MTTYSYHTTISSGSTANVAVPFPYLDRSHVHVTLDDVIVVDNTIVWASAGVLTLAAIPANGVAVKVYRVTPRDTLDTRFSSPSVFDPEDLNHVCTQLLYVTQEAFDLGGATADELAAITDYVNAAMAASAASAASASTSAGNASTSASAASTSALSAAASAAASATSAAAVRYLDLDDFRIPPGPTSYPNDDADAFDRLIAAAAAQGLPARFQGQCSISRPIYIGNVTFGGTTGKSHDIIVPNLNSSGVIINASGARLSNFQIGYGPKCNRNCTLVLGSPGTVHIAGHNFAANQPMYFGTTGGLLTGLLTGGYPPNIYFVKTVIDADNFTVSGTAGGAPIAFTGSQSGTHTAYSTSNPGTVGLGADRLSGEVSAFSVRDMTIDGAANGFVTIKASGFIFRDNDITNFSSNGIIVQNQNVVDSGDSVIAGNELGGAGFGGIGIVWNSSSGTRIHDNKFNGYLSYGILVALAPGAFCADLFIHDNSIEGISAEGVSIAFARGGTTGGLGVVVISDNELSGKYGVHVDTDANGAWIQSMACVGNVVELYPYNANAVAFSIDSCNGAIIDGNSIHSFGAGVKSFDIKSGVTQLTVGINNQWGVAFAASTFAASTCEINYDGLRGGTSGGVPYYSETGRLSYSTVLTSGQLMVGGGAGQPPATTPTPDIGAATGTSLVLSGAATALNYKIGLNQVLGGRVTGYAAMTGTPDKATVYATSTVTLAQLAGRVAQLQADLTAHGLMGA